MRAFKTVVRAISTVWNQPERLEIAMIPVLFSFHRLSRRGTGGIEKTRGLQSQLHDNTAKYTIKVSNERNKRLRPLLLLRRALLGHLRSPFRAFTLRLEFVPFSFEICQTVNMRRAYVNDFPQNSQKGGRTRAQYRQVSRL